MGRPRLCVFHKSWEVTLHFKTQTIHPHFIQMTGIELFIVIGGCYAIYTVGMAIATNIDYYSTNKDEQLVKTARQYQNEK